MYNSFQKQNTRAIPRARASMIVCSRDTAKTAPYESQSSECWSRRRCVLLYPLILQRKTFEGCLKSSMKCFNQYGQFKEFVILDLNNAYRYSLEFLGLQGLFLFTFIASIQLYSGFRLSLIKILRHAPRNL